MRHPSKIPHNRRKAAAYGRNYDLTCRRLPFSRDIKVLLNCVAPDPVLSDITACRRAVWAVTIDIITRNRPTDSFCGFMTFKARCFAAVITSIIAPVLVYNFTYHFYTSLLVVIVTTDFYAAGLRPDLILSETPYGAIFCPVCIRLFALFPLRSIQFRLFRNGLRLQVRIGIPLCGYGRN